MNFLPDLDPTLTNWVLIPLLIFCARLLDVSLGTLRIVFIAKGNKFLAPILGFFEVLIWLVAMGQVMQNLTNVASYLAWAGGFAVGNLLGLRLEEKLAIGQMVVRVITSEPATQLTQQLKSKGYGLTCVDAHGKKGKVNLLFMIVKRKNLEEVIGIISHYNPKAFYSIEDVRSVSAIDRPETQQEETLFRRLFPIRKGK
ncbi:MAG: DUF2179 domain-containing protein [Hymenobacteraceae bacterium]|nr:DUF2179 domain-containing protein [Hymenobacteraceae bacterium]MDX5397581.1 DUF2179 domain-containing protein [Hymenobacteraceae bacterium]MDX5442625.1 DUF2179 domain-containing protein [Hymenobacteraceae bacterium]MDX5513661.1 DUF2179 domain-containing protein [Hymenobacteraceae bacterium]